MLYFRSVVEACRDGDVNAVRKFLAEGQTVNEKSEMGDSLLSLACAAGHYELAQVSCFTIIYSLQNKEDSTRLHFVFYCSTITF